MKKERNFMKKERKIKNLLRIKENNKIELLNIKFLLSYLSL
jgi:hypothetical protein